MLTVVYLLFNEGYLPTSGVGGPDLTEDAEWLAALIRLHRARVAARFDEAGTWCCCAIRTGPAGITRRLPQPRRCSPAPRAATGRGAYQLQAAIVAWPAEAKTWADTDWPQILVLYGMLLRHAPSLVTRLHRAIALWHAAGAEAALAELSTLDTVLDRYHLYHATLAELLRELCQPDAARAADRRALELTANPAERALLEQRILDA